MLEAMSKILKFESNERMALGLKPIENSLDNSMSENGDNKSGNQSIGDKLINFFL